MTKRGRFILGTGLVVLVIGIGAVTLSDYDITGTILIVVGLLLVALRAGKGRRKGAQVDH